MHLLTSYAVARARFLDDSFFAASRQAGLVQSVFVESHQAQVKTGLPAGGPSGHGSKRHGFSSVQPQTRHTPSLDGPGLSFTRITPLRRETGADYPSTRSEFDGSVNATAAALALYACLASIDSLAQ